MIALGLLDAVDVWGAIGGGYEVCFPQAGRIVFLDASTSPRAVHEIAHYTDGDFTCVRDNRAGTLVLVTDAPPTTADDAPVANERPVPTAPIVFPDHSEVVSLADCQIITRYNMHHRASPAGRSKGIVPGDMLLAATKRTARVVLRRLQRPRWLAEHAVPGLLRRVRLPRPSRRVGGGVVCVVGLWFSR